MDLNLKGKVALVTGSGGQKGFGRAIAVSLAKEGCDIIVNDINLDDAKITAAEIEGLGRQAIAVKADVSNSKEVNDMVKAGLAKFGKIDILVNNAGKTTKTKHFVDVTEEEWDEVISLDLKGPFNCTKAVLPQMLSRKYGKIISISSGAGRTGLPTAVAYSAAKAGVIAFTKAVAADVAASGINVNAVAPGPAETDFQKHAQSPPEMKAMFLQMIPLKRYTVTQDIANVVTFLASDAANDVVGQTLSVDGGLVMV